MLAMEGDNKRAGAIINYESMGRDQVKREVDSYMKLYEDDQGDGGVEKRKQNYETLANSFYDLVTNFYEYGWGQSFHFAPRHKWESFEASIARHEMYLAHRLRLAKGQTALDVGCGVGGPARCIARFSEAHVVGLNNNDYQIGRAKILTKEAGLDHLVSYVKADFMHIPVQDNTYDAVYSVEATCHAPSKVGVYSEVFRVLKPGGLYGTYEWVITDNYDENDPEHVKIKEGIEVGNGLPDLEKPSDLMAALKEAGFEVLDAEDLAKKSDTDTPWYLPLSGSFSLMGFKHTRIGRTITHAAVSTLEYLKIAPEGTTKVSQMLCETADDLVNGGKQDVFTRAFRRWPCGWGLRRRAPSGPPSSPPLPPPHRGV